MSRDNFIPPVDLTGALQNEPLFEKDRVSRLQGFESAISEAFHEGPLARISLVAEKEINNTWPHETFNESEWKKSEFFRKDINFNGISNSSGLVSKQYAEDVAQHRDAKLQREETMAAMPPGFLSGASRFAGGTIGFMLDPINAASALAAPEYIGTKAASILDAVKKFSSPIRFSVRTGIGAAEGLSVVAPQVATQLLTDRPIGMPIETASALSTVSLAIGTGGLVRGVFGFKSPVTPESHQESLQTAVGQAASGKSVDVEPILNQGYYAARKSDFVNFEDKNAQNLHEERINEVRRNISNKEESLREELSKNQNSPENIKAFSVLSTPIEQRSIGDVEFLRTYTEQGERNLIKDRLKNEQRELDTLKIKEPLEEEDKEKLETLKKSRELSNNRIAELSGKKSVNEKELNKLYTQLDQLDSSQAASTAMNLNPGEPLTTSDLTASSEHVDSYKGDSIYHESKTKAFEAQVEESKKNENTDWESEKEKYENDIPQEARNEFDERVLEDIKKKEEDVKNYSRGLRSVVDCLLRNS